MKKTVFSLSLITLIAISTGLIYQGNPTLGMSEFEKFKYSKSHYRPRPEPAFIVEKDTDFDSLEGEEKDAFLAEIQRQEDGNYRMATLYPTPPVSRLQSMAEDGIYANGKVKGKWKYLIPHTTGKTKTTGKGFRVDNSTYDPETGSFYVVPYSKHLWKLDRNTKEKWFLLNNKITLTRIFDGLNLPDGSFRLIRCKKESNTVGYMMYSDDEGATWQKANGLNILNNYGFESAIVNNNGKPRILVLVGTSAKINGSTVEAAKVYYSDDYGQNYQATSLALAKSEYKYHEDCAPHIGKNVKLVKVYNSNDVYLFERSNSTQRIVVHHFNHSTKEFDKISTSVGSYKQDGSLMTNGTFGNAMYSMFGTKVDGKTHFYGSLIGNLKYSDDMGLNWHEKNNDAKKLENIHPTKPNIILKGFTDYNVSTDYGKTFRGTKRVFGWDMQHIQSYLQKDNTYITVVGNDHGFYTSTTPEDENSFDWHNYNQPFGMHYDMDCSETLNTTFVANQDRGIGAYRDTSHNPAYLKVEGTDVMRTCVANAGKSVWFRFYYSKIQHNHNFTLGDTRIVGRSKDNDGNKYGDWTAPPMTPSHIPGEDAIFLAGKNKLKKLIYNNASNSIKEETFPFDFKSATNNTVSGVCQNPHNTNLIYVMTKNGKFFYSQDGGANFTQSAASNLPAADGSYYKRWHTIRVSPNNPQRIYVTGSAGKFMLSSDGGKTFTSMSNGMSGITRIYDFDFTSDERYFFIAAEGAGGWVYVTEDNKWYQFSGGIVPTNVKFTSVRYLDEKQTVRFSTYGAGVIDYELDAEMFSTALKENSAESHISLYPNPTQNSLNIKNSGDMKIQSYSIFDLEGRCIINNTWTDATLNVSSLLTGQYVLSLNTDKGIIRQQFIKD